MATLKDVAQLACVDVSTVSRALSGKGYVHPNTRAKINAAVKQLSYQPNLLAKGLREGKRNVVGLVVPTLNLSVFSEIAQGIEERARQSGYETILCHTDDDPDREEQLLRRLRSSYMDGLIIGFAGCVPELICPAREVFAHPEQHTLKEAQDWSDRIYHISQAIYGGGQPSGEAHARLKEALVQRGIFSSGLMRKPVLPLNQEEKDWISLGLERSQLPKVDMSKY